MLIATRNPRKYGIKNGIKLIISLPWELMFNKSEMKIALLQSKISGDSKKASPKK